MPRATPNNQPIPLSHDPPPPSSSRSSLYSAYSYYQLDSPSGAPTSDSLQVPSSPYVPPPLAPHLPWFKPRRSRTIPGNSTLQINCYKKVSDTMKQTQGWCDCVQEEREDTRRQGRRHTHVGAHIATWLWLLQRRESWLLLAAPRSRGGCGETLNELVRVRCKRRARRAGPRDLRSGSMLLPRMRHNEGSEDGRCNFRVVAS